MNIFLFLLLLVYAKAATIPGINSHEQYATVMRAEDYVFSSGAVGDYPSLFIGLFHMAVLGNVTTTVEITIWHGMEFAQQIEIRGPAERGLANNASLPLLVIARALDGNIAPELCPLTRTFVVTAGFLQNLRTGLLYVQIIADQVSGHIRGQLEARRDVLVDFASPPGQYTAVDGMSILYVTLAEHQPGQVGVQYWILSRKKVGVFNAVTGSSNFSVAATFGPVPAGVTTDVSLVIASQGFYLSIAESEVFSYPGSPPNPLTGPGSSRLSLQYQGNFLTNVYSDYIRMPVTSDFAILNGSLQSNGSGRLAPSFVLLIFTLLLLEKVAQKQS